MENEIILKLDKETTIPLIEGLGKAPMPLRWLMGSEVLNRNGLIV